MCIYMSTQYLAPHRDLLQHTATHCNILQHTATHCNTLQKKNSMEGAEEFALEGMDELLVKNSQKSARY